MGSFYQELTIKVLKKIYEKQSVDQFIQLIHYYHYTVIIDHRSIGYYDLPYLRKNTEPTIYKKFKLITTLLPYYDFHNPCYVTSLVTCSFLIKIA